MQTHYVLPATLLNRWGGELERLTLQRTFLARNSPGCVVWLIAPDDQVDVLRRTLATREVDYQFVPEGSLVSRRNEWEWYVQQQAKLLAFKLDVPAWFVTLDSDLFPCRPFRTLDWIRDGRVRVQHIPCDVSQEISNRWNVATAALFGVPPMDFCWPVTPAIYNRDVLRETAKEIDPNTLLGTIKGWSEMSVYQYGAARLGMLDSHHELRFDDPLCEFVEHLGRCRANLFDNPARPPFVCFNSVRGFSPEYVRRHLETEGVIHGEGEGWRDGYVSRLQNQVGP